MHHAFIIMKNNQDNIQNVLKSIFFFLVKLSTFRIKLQVYEIYWRDQ